VTVRRRPRLRLGVTHKLWLSVVAMVVAVLLPVGFAVDRAATAFYYQQNAAELLALGQRFADFVARAPAQGAGEAVRALAEITATPLLVLDGSGAAVAASSDLAAEVGRRPQNPRILSALGGEPSVFLAADDSLGSLVVAAVPVRSGDQVTGAVVLFRPAAGVRQAAARVRGLLAAAAAALFLLLAAFGWLLSRRLVRPLIAMKTAADHLARGDYTVRVEAPGADELGELAEAVNRLGASLHDLETSRRRFFANISHELRTPLSYLRGYADALAEGLAASPDQVKEVGRILSDEARRLGRLVEDLFVLAQAEEGGLSLHLAEVDVGDAARKVLERARPKADEKGIALEARIPPGAAVVADPDRLEQILLNLLDNAVRYTPPGGTVRLSVEKGSGDQPAAGPARVPSPSRGRVPAEPAWLHVAVDDTGPGLEGDPGRVWERFYRGDRSQSRELGGAGLGLAIVRSLVEAQGGRVWAEARGPLGGARVGFSLPAPKAVPAEKPPWARP